MFLCINKVDIYYYITMGNLFEFSGTAHAEITEFERSNTKDNLASVEKSIKDSGIENVSVKSSDKGLVISLENIKFKADSSLLLDSEKQKLDMIGKILQKFPNNDILVTGNPALARIQSHPAPQAAIS